MSDNKTMPTEVQIESFLGTISDRRRDEANQLIKIMVSISGHQPVMWGPSIIGFGINHYKYETGREGEMPKLGFSPRKSAITIYFIEGFNDYGQELRKLGKYKNSMSCLYINKLTDIDIQVLGDMLNKSYERNSSVVKKTQSVEEYVNNVPIAARAKFDDLRKIVKSQLPDAKEVFSYGVVGYKVDDKRARVFISGWKDHVAMYPIPKDDNLRKALKQYIRGKGTLWFDLDNPLPKEIIASAVKSLATH